MTDTAFYDEMIATANELLTDFGAPVTLTKIGAGSGGYDDFGNPIPAEPDTTVSGVGAKFSYNGDAMQGAGTTIVDGDCYMLFQSAAGAPEIGMTTTLSGVIWRVVAVSPLDPAGIVVMYNLQIRR